MAYLYSSNLDPLSRTDQLEIVLDNGDTAILRMGHSYDLTVNELSRARRYVVMTSTGAAADEEPIGVRYLPVKGNPTANQVPQWSANDGAFLPATVSGVSGGPYAPAADVTALDSRVDVVEGKVGTTVWISPSSTSGTTLNAAIIALGLAGGTIALRKGSHTWDSVPRILPFLTGWLRIVAEDGASVVAASGGPRFVDFRRVADYDIFRKVRIEDIDFDRNGITAGFHESVIGNEFGGGWGQRVNFEDIEIDGVRLKNVPVGATSSLIYQGISFGSSHPANDEATQTKLQRFKIRDVDIQGGNVGVAILGSGGSGNASVNVYHDELHCENVSHDTGSTSSSTRTDAGIQLGGTGFGKTARITGGTLKRHMDVGIEIDSFLDFIGDKVVVEDSKVAKLFCRNFHAVDYRIQKNTWRNCTTRQSTYPRDPTTAASSDYMIGGDAATAQWIFGEMSVEGGLSTTELAPTGGVNGAIVLVNNVQARKFSMRGHSAVFKNYDVAAGSNFPTFYSLRSMLAGATYDVEARLKIQGVRTGTGANSNKTVTVAGTDAHADIFVDIDVADWTGMSSGSDVIYGIGLGMDYSATLRGRVRVRVSGGNAASFHGVYLDPTNLTLPGEKFLVELDTARAPAGAGLDLNAPTALKPKVQARVISQRTQVSGSGLLQLDTALTPAASPWAFQNLEMMPVLFVVAGGTVSDISLSADGSAYRTTGQTAGAFYVPIGWYVRVTYTVAPTTARKMPA